MKNHQRQLCNVYPSSTEYDVTFNKSSRKEKEKWKKKREETLLFVYRGRGRGENGEIYLKNEIAKEKIRQKKKKKIRKKDGRKGFK